MKTKTVFLALAIMAIVSGVISAQSDSLSLVNLSVSPNPVIAGGNVTIKFQLYNSYDSWLYGGTLQPTGSYPLLNVSPLNTYILGVINSGQNPRYSNVTLSPTYYNFSFRIPSTTPSGTYTITFVSTYFLYAGVGTETASSYMPVSFYVQNKPAITVSASSPTPSALYTGYNQTLNLVINDTGYGTARNVSLTVSGGPGLNILSSVTTFFVSNLTRGSSVREPLLVSAHSISNPYILVNATYYSSTFQQRFSSTQRINLSVAPSAQFTINSEGPSPAIGASDVPISFSITNTGTSTANQLQLSLQTTYPISPAASTAYVNDLPPGTSTNVTFFINVDSSGVSGNYPVTLYEQWRQPSGAVNQQFAGSDSYYIGVGQAGLTTGSLTTDAIVVIVVIAIGIFAYRRFAAKTRKKTEKK